jgi:biopolymer transport protein TolQ
MWSLVSNASIVVQLVMLILVGASVTSWIMIFQRSNMLRAGKRALDLFEERFWSGIDLSKLYRQAGSNPDPDSGVEQVFRAGFKEFSRLRQQAGVDPDAVMEGVGRAMRVAISREEEKLETSLPFLATVGSVSPYIGLFGTVWGIMNSFRGLAAVQQATLATVAPGISEALVATAIGLFASPRAAKPSSIATTPSPKNSRPSCTVKCTPAKSEQNPNDSRSPPQTQAGRRDERGALHRRDVGTAGHLHGHRTDAQPGRESRPAQGFQRSLAAGQQHSGPDHFHQG